MEFIRMKSINKKKIVPEEILAGRGLIGEQTIGSIIDLG
jgi:hypothetical protein